jgi:acylphosphatase
MASVRKRLLYSGRVQGVGFRATARALSSRFPVAGYVRNLPSGEVELVAEGEPDAVANFLAAVRSAFQFDITGVSEQDEPPSGLKGFTVRH